ncbi:MAG: NUDIX pyrophosphatase [Dehalococcoidia bacterium]|nr:NUDIX pyrophosphatase [Dehalococcoidia bacterium]MDW8119554.1 NUDIX pyrophosphatase [Chloroflexota bacterium]
MCSQTSPRPVVTAFLVHGGKVLLLRRSALVRTCPSRWAGVSGSIPPGVDPLAQAYQEVQEETGLLPEGLTLCAQGTPLTVQHEQGGAWRVHPFAFRIADPTPIRLNWEHTEMRWVDPEAIRTLPTVPGLWEAWERVQGCLQDPSNRGGEHAFRTHHRGDMMSKGENLSHTPP